MRAAQGAVRGLVSELTPDRLGAQAVRVVIYCYTNQTNGKKYVGQTTCKTAGTTPLQAIDDRYDSGSGYVACRAFYNALLKYGRENFDVEVLGLAHSRVEADALESEWISKSNSLSPNGYNIRSGGGGHSLHEDTKQLISDKLKLFWQSLPGEQRAGIVAKMLSKAEPAKAAFSYWAKLSPEERSARVRAAVAKVPVERRRESAAKARAAWMAQSTPEQRSEVVRKNNAMRSPEERSETVRRMWAGFSKEKRAEIIRKGMVTKGPEALKAAGRKLAASRSAESLSETSRKAWAAGAHADHGQKVRATRAARSEEEKKALSERQSRRLLDGAPPTLPCSYSGCTSLATRQSSTAARRRSDGKAYCDEHRWGAQALLPCVVCGLESTQGSTYAVREGIQQNAYCAKCRGPARSKYKQCVGQTFGQLTVIGLEPNSMFACVCSCGTAKSIAAYHVVQGNTVSCGCYGGRKGRLKSYA